VSSAAAQLQRQARAARATVEDALGPDVHAWRWAIGASRLIDLWISMEERAA
jgi:hypothetical protein